MINCRDYIIIFDGGARTFSIAIAKSTCDSNKNVE